MSEIVFTVVAFYLLSIAVTCFPFILSQLMQTVHPLLWVESGGGGGGRAVSHIDVLMARLAFFPSFVA